MMDCSQCGYAMDAFDVDCPRCKRIASAQQRAEKSNAQAQMDEWTVIAPAQPVEYPAVPTSPPPHQQQRRSSAGTGDGDIVSRVFGVLLIICVCTAVGYYVSRSLSGESSIVRLDGQHISVRAHIGSYSVSDVLWTGTVVIDEGPLSGTEMVGAGIADPLGPIGAGTPVRMTGTASVRPRGFLQGYDVQVNSMILLPE